MRRDIAGQATHLSRVRGSLLGGALGDALGNPVEFLSLAGIRDRYGDRGITELATNRAGLAEITDDTQMSLFTIEGLRDGYYRARTRGIGGAIASFVHASYLRWLDTQDYPEPPAADSLPHRTGSLRKESWLYAVRAPGNACLSGLRSGQTVEPFAELTGKPGPVNPDSKGCGTVMRSAPFGFLGDPRSAFLLAGNCAQLTHGHPTGYYAAASFAEIIAWLMNGESLRGAVLQSLRTLASHPGHEETSAALRAALDLADEGDPTAGKVERLGAGWIAEEALAIGVYSALATVTGSDEFDIVKARLRLSVNHSGDSDSTGSVCGNLIGAVRGDVGLPFDWLRLVEARGQISAVADDFVLSTGQARSW
ncbi:ADP-ribosylglycohydrolase family protein [Amycolatopsis benzoatilytica]|uniref:ADP-ribosylglycohydrolase family protein n=1 Tax=Amycolatopsis benzoatilytica TaxID=346045 RepID=UPI000378A36E|nr:ADP-ribosylglycohydrolase family protein [Amycolatopsis benzoatilytica]